MSPISAEALSVQQLFRKGTFDTARSQRDYQWSDRECSQLLIDLDEAFRKAGLNPDPDAPPDTASDADDSHDEALPATDAAAPPPLRGTTLSPARRKPPQHYFLGPIVLYRRPRVKDGYTIYDGQQRLTTLSIMLAALRDQLRDGEWLEIQELLRTNNDRMQARLEVSTPGGSLRRITGTLGETK